MDTSDIKPMLPTDTYDPTEVILIGALMPPGGKTGAVKVHSNRAAEIHITPKGGTAPTLAVIYAYGHEGHMYRLPKPRVMVVEGEGTDHEDGLKLWRMTKDDDAICVEIETGDVSKLLLDANQPSNRAANSYAAHMQMSHRGGKMS